MVGRKAGAKNVDSFNDRANIATTADDDIKHLARVARATNLATFKTLIDHQFAYLKWIDDRHKELKKLKLAQAPGNRGPKESTYQKYKWYSEQLTTLEAINAFETFYKQTLISLAKAIRDHVPAERLKGAVDSKILWSVRGKFSIIEVLFEHQLFHDLDKIDEITHILLQKKRYAIGSASAELKKTIKSLESIFQIRHTLSHNQGYVTISDAAKFKMKGRFIESFEVIDPSKDKLGYSIRKFLLKEASNFTSWLISATTEYLKAQATNSGAVLSKSTLARIENEIGTSAKLKALPWNNA